jgi:hypothetical protein
LGDCLHWARIFNTQESRVFGLLFYETGRVFIADKKNGLGYISGDFFLTKLTRSPVGDYRGSIFGSRDLIFSAEN